MMEPRLFFPRASRLCCLAATLIIMGLGLVGCSDDEATTVGPAPPLPANPVGTIQIYSDAGGTSCSIADNPTGLETVYLFHSDHQGVTASQFTIDTGGTGFVWIADQGQDRTLTIGNTSIGASFAYGMCIGTDYHFASVTYQCNGTANLCSVLRIVPDSFTGEINAVSCGNNNSSANSNCAPIAASQSTWARVGALNE
ncbi:MAG: hypothetical protein IH969_05290 [Candidatus Krumholzibacteriota bacterium]|nr:hypothetical protein [Candidatus Krumholzibacteriota bacterium]